VVLVTDDHTRPTPVARFLPAVLESLAAGGVADDRIDILLATGVHRPTRDDEAAEKLGREIAGRLRWRCHDAYDQASLVDVGTTSRGTRVFYNRLLAEADLVVCVGAIEPHLLLGFGGGLKMLLPGCAGSETIGTNHMQGVAPDSFDFVGTPASPMRLDLEEAAGLLKKELFIVNVIMNEDFHPARFFCGDAVEAHRAGVALSTEVAANDVPEQADVVLANSYPMDEDLRQSAKCLGNTLYACKPGGVMMGCVRCAGGLGEMPIPKVTLPYPLLRFLVHLIGKKRVLPLVERVKKGEPVEEVFVGHFGLQMLRRNHLALFSEILPAETGRKMGLARVYNDLDAMVRWVAGRAPRDATVWAFPYGGVTYATHNG
jgi:nickel-dependent lactate racemase